MCDLNLRLSQNEQHLREVRDYAIGAKKNSNQLLSQNDQHLREVRDYAIGAKIDSDQRLKQNEQRMKSVREYAIGAKVESLSYTTHFTRAFVESLLRENEAIKAELKKLMHATEVHYKRWQIQLQLNAATTKKVDTMHVYMNKRLEQLDKREQDKVRMSDTIAKQGKAIEDLSRMMLQLQSQKLEEDQRRVRQAIEDEEKDSQEKPVLKDMQAKEQGNANVEQWLLAFNQSTGEYQDLGKFKTIEDRGKYILIKK